MSSIQSFLAAAILGGTGFSTPTANFTLTDATTACALLSKQAVEELSKIHVTKGVPQLTLDGATSCMFRAATGGRVLIIFRPAAPDGWVNDQLVRLERGVQLGTYRYLPGYGEHSYLHDLPGSGAVLCIVSGRRYLQIAMVGFVDDLPFAKILANLATAAAARLNVG